MTKVIAAETGPDGRFATVSLSTGETFRFHAVYLRDNAPEPGTIDPGSGQRLLTLADIPADVALARAEAREERLAVVFAPCGTETAFDADWLAANAYDRPADHAPGWRDGADWGAGHEIHTAPWPDMLEPPVLRDWLAAVRRDGVAMLTGGPARSGALLALIEAFGYVRETNYGCWFDVRATVNAENLAYTGLGLQAHTDNPYRDPQPTLQVLWCIENSAEGGDSMVVDGFRAARLLRERDPAAFALLSGHPARFAYAGTGARLSSKRPMIELGPDGELIAVRFNNRSAAPFRDVAFDQMEAYYAAYRAFAEIISDPAQAVAFKLAPGDAFIVDNTRVLHARRGYSGEGSRWLQGAYADRDGLYSTLELLEAAHGPA